MDIFANPWFWIAYTYAGFSCFMCWFDPRYYQGCRLWTPIRHGIICVAIWPLMPLFFLGVHFWLYVRPALVHFFWLTVAFFVAASIGCWSAICRTFLYLRGGAREEEGVRGGCLKGEETPVEKGRDNDNPT